MAGKKTRATMRQHGSWLIYNHMGPTGRSIIEIDFSNPWRMPEQSRGA